MCGIAAIVRSDPRDLDRMVAAMNATLTHRGPDDSGQVVVDGGAALAMRRLSILDLEGGHQPMWDESRTHCVVFNGEIYNFAELRHELTGRGHRFQTDHSDTEVLVHGYEEWGLELFARLNGMFALALWDGRTQQLVVARDRTGEKPLYVGRLPDGYAVASELKALFTLPDLSRELDLVGVEQYLAFDYVIGPRTILRDVRKVPAGDYGVITAGSFTHRPYWTLSFAEVARDERVLLDELDALLDGSVRMRMVADVPVGLLLSGGVDSSAVGWYMRRHSDDVHSFSVGFEESSFDESHHAERVARDLGTTHHLEVFSQDRVRDLIPRVTEILDEPMGDQSIFPTHLLSVFARREVKVALGGDGSDELFMGYKSYQPLKVAWQLDRLPRPVLRAMAGTARRLPTRVGPMPLRGVQFARTVDMGPVNRLLGHLGSFKGESRWILSPDVRRALPSSVYDGVGRTLLGEHVRVNGSGADTSIAAYVRSYLQEDILVKVDRASMAASLEVRSPFLDPGLIDFLGSVPASAKMRGLRRKHLLRTLMRGRLPDEILDRPKMGFGVPLDLWLRESLAPLVREHLSRERVAATGLFDPDAVARLVDEHLSARVNRGRQIWQLLQFELWRERWLR